MKKILPFLVSLALAAGTQLQAQTNTFPGSGNVGIGTTNPSMPLTVKGPNTIADFQSTAASALLYFTPSGYDQWRIGAGEISANDFGIRDMTTNLNRLSIDQTRMLVSNGPSIRSQLTISDTNTSSIMLRAGASQQSVLASDVGLSIRTGANWTNADAGGVTAMAVLTNGNVGIGITNPGYPLDVNGTIHAKEVIVDTSGADYVFASNYKLMPLPEVEQAIRRDKHLPGIPSAQQMSSGGLSVGDLQAKLLAKIEELTLHQIEQEKQLKEQAQRIEHLENENAELRATH